MSGVILDYTNIEFYYELLFLIRALYPFRKIKSKSALLIGTRMAYFIYLLLGLVWT